MKRPLPTWERIAAAARQAPASDESSPEGWSARVAARALRQGALAPPTTATVALAWVARAKWLGLTLVAAAAVGTAVVPRWVRESTEVRCQRWAAETLRQLKAWYPLSCEDAGELGQLMQHRLLELRAVRTNLTQVDELIDRTHADIAAKLKPEEREAFAASQSRLRNRLQLGDAPAP